MWKEKEVEGEKKQGRGDSSQKEKKRGSEVSRSLLLNPLFWSEILGKKEEGGGGGAVCQKRRGDQYQQVAKRRRKRRVEKRNRYHQFWEGENGFFSPSFPNFSQFSSYFGIRGELEERGFIAQLLGRKIFRFLSSADGRNGEKKGWQKGGRKRGEELSGVIQARLMGWGKLFIFSCFGGSGTLPVSFWESFVWF